MNGKGYAIYDEYDFCLADGKYGYPNGSPMDFYNILDPIVGTGCITVEKSVTCMGISFDAVDETFYVALYLDEECTEMVSDIKEMYFWNSASETVSFDDLPLGNTYYVAEVDEYGNVLNRSGGLTYGGDMFQPKFYEGNMVELTEEEPNQTLQFTNDFLTQPGYYDNPDASKHTLTIH